MTKRASKEKPRKTLATSKQEDNPRNKSNFSVNQNIAASVSIG
jgi:hypothetical protein